MDKVGMGRDKSTAYNRCVVRPDNPADLSVEAYRQFIKSKVAISQEYGFPIDPAEIHPIAKPHQRDSIVWTVRGGRRAIFAAFGLGKSIMQLEVLRLTLKHHGSGRALIVAPLNVRNEFRRDARSLLGFDVHFVRSMDDVRQAEMFEDCSGIFVTNYETVREGKLNPSEFIATSLDEAAILRSFGGTKTFREFMKLFENVPYRFVATATPDPNEFIELLAYAAFLGIMDVSAAKTRWFKRNSTKADDLTLRPEKEEEFWLWVASWALFLQSPADLGHSDEGYALPPMEVIFHEVKAERQIGQTVDVDGQVRMFADASLGVSQAAKEKRDTIHLRVAKVQEIVRADPEKHFLLWHDQEKERTALEKAIPGLINVYGAQNLEERENYIVDFAEGRLQYLGAKPVMLGAGCNFQRHCADAVFTGIGFKFNEFIQAVHRIYRFLQDQPVRIHLIYADTEKRILKILMDKWENHKRQAQKMSEIIQRFGLSQQAMVQSMQRALGCKRVEVIGKNYRLINNDCVEEAYAMPDNSVGLVLTSWPFGTQYEYSKYFADFGHNESNAAFFEQQEFLTPQIFRILQPGRIYAVHVKDRIVPGGLTGLGFQTVYPFHLDAIQHCQKHGFGYIGMKTIVTDVVRENNQTYRLGWTEQCKDGSKMGVGMPEYLLLFRKPPTDTTKAYADIPVFKDKGGVMHTCPNCGFTSDKHTKFKRSKDADDMRRQCPKCEQMIEMSSEWKNGYSRSRWQIDAHGFERSSGNRPLLPEELASLPHHQIFKLFKKYSLENVYDFEYHVKLGEDLERKGRLPVTFMLLQPQSWSPEVWSDITRMRTLNGAQSAKGKMMHICLAVGSLVLTRNGYQPIETVEVGDEVLTHKGRWRRVQVSCSTGVRPIVEVCAQGVSGLRLTPDHKLWTRTSKRVRTREGAEIVEPEWLEAKDTLGSYVNFKLPPVEASSLSELEWWIVGRWLADGHQETRGGFVVSVGPEKLPAFLDKIGHHAGGQHHLAAIQVRLKELSDPLKATLRQCGRGASGKRLPPEAFMLSVENAQSLLAGYLSGDGHYLAERHRWNATSISRELLLGLAVLAQRVYGAIASIYPGRAPGEAVIEGRTVATKQEWAFCFDVPQDGDRCAPFILDDGAWKKVRSVEPAGEAETWNLRVEEDESYTAEGCIVKNCPIQFDIVDRVIAQMSNPGDVVFDPFNGLGTVTMLAVKHGRYGLGTELNGDYFADSCFYAESAEKQLGVPTLFDLAEVEDEAEFEEGADAEEVDEEEAMVA